MIQVTTEVLGEKPVQMPVCTLQNQHVVEGDGTWVFKVRATAPPVGQMLFFWNYIILNLDCLVTVVGYMNIHLPFSTVLLRNFNANLAVGYKGTQVQAAMYVSCYTVYTGCNRRNGPDFGRVFLMLNYTEKPQNTYIQS